MIRFFKKLFKRGDFMTRADKAYYKYRAKTFFWSAFCLIIIAWVGTNLVLCALSTNVESNFDMIYEAAEPVTLPIGTEFNRVLKGATSFSFDPNYAKMTDRTIKSITFDKFSDDKGETYNVDGVDVLKNAVKETISAENGIYLYRANSGADIYVLSNNIMQANPDSSFMFFGLGKCETFNFNNFSTSQVNNMMGMFAGNNNSRIYIITWPSVPDFPVNEHPGMERDIGTHSGMKSLDLSGWDVSNVTNMYGMFHVCENLQSLDLSSWNTGSVTTMKYMFHNCSALTNLNVSGWDTKNVEDMYGMFQNLPTESTALYSLDLSSFDTRNVKDMRAMFEGTFDFYCGLQTIYASDRFMVDQVEQSSYMFAFCKYLVGGQGTQCTGNSRYSIDSANDETINKTYARIDGKDGQKGYFTEKAYSGK